MDTVHVFISTGRFRSFDEMRAYIDQTYTEDGDGIPSAFMREVGLSEYEPGCIEAIETESGQPVPLRELLAGASYSDQWLSSLDGSRPADAAICVFAPNRLARPERCSLEYVGAFPYSHEVWCRTLIRLSESRDNTPRPWNGEVALTSAPGSQRRCRRQSLGDPA